VVTVKLGVTGKSYLNGSLVGSQTPATYYSVSETLKIGTESTAYFSGAIDDVRVYNRALSAQEVKQLYNMGK
jgi:hypothetical protein